MSAGNSNSNKKAAGKWRDPGNPLLGQSQMQITQLNNQQALPRVVEAQTSALEMHGEERVPARQLRVNAESPSTRNVKQRAPFPSQASL